MELSNELVGFALIIGSIVAFAMANFLKLAIARTKEVSKDYSYCRELNPALYRAGANDAHGMVVGDDHTLVPQSRKSESYYESFS